MHSAESFCALLTVLGSTSVAFDSAPKGNAAFGLFPPSNTYKKILNKNSIKNFLQEFPFELLWQMGLRTAAAYYLLQTRPLKINLLLQTFTTGFSFGSGFAGCLCDNISFSTTVLV